jgi:uncharacterized lipoprotein YbaY
VSFRYTCLIDGNGEAVAFNSTDLLPEERQAAPSGTILRGNAFYRPRIRLPRGAELRVQLLDATRSPAGEVLTEAVVRSSWVEPMPFGLRLPPDIKFDGRKLVVDARLAVGSATLYRLKQRHTIAAGELQKSITLMLDAVVGSSP